MRLLFTALIFSFHFHSVAQLAKTEHYAVLQFAYCNGTEEQTFNWQQGGETKSLKLDLGTAIAFETGLGFRLIDSFFSEATVSYFINNSLAPVNDNGVIYDQGFTFNRLAFNLKGNYILAISENTSLNFKAGFSYYLPQDCIIYFNNQQKVLKYSQNLAPFVGFGFNIEKNWFVTQIGLRYKAESHYLTNHGLNSIDESLHRPNFNSIDVGVSVMILF